ncbi:MAG: DUF2785 domain-containing protein [Vicinamibacteria bacterium]|nr:DUF2785 domain-containing protein [Vicinamibacteria bacterium]
MIPVLPLLVARLMLVGPAAPLISGSAPCSPAGLTTAALLELKRAKFEVSAADERNRLAVTLLSCLDDPDPAIRDGVVFEGLSTWLRGKALTSATIITLEGSLRRTLTGAKDEGGFRLPFAALALSEVARADRIEPVFTEQVRAALVEVAASSLERVDDYRGFDPVSGWRHGVAHGSDLILQLALNSRVGVEGLSRLMQATASQIAPPGPVFYTFGEPDRLARAVVFTYRRGLLDTAFWEGWFASLTKPAPLSDWGAAFRSVEGLAKRHNTIAFLQALSFAGRSGGDEAGRAVATMADHALTQIMRG